MTIPRTTLEKNQYGNLTEWPTGYLRRKSALPLRLEAAKKAYDECEHSAYDVYEGWDDQHNRPIIDEAIHPDDVVWVLARAAEIEKILKIERKIAAAANAAEKKLMPAQEKKLIPIPTKIEIVATYRGETEADGWGNRPVLIGLTYRGDSTPVTDPAIIDRAEIAFQKMLKECGEFVSTLVHIGETSDTILRV
jgi:hypothetical protein